MTRIPIDLEILDGARERWAQYSPPPPWSIEELLARVEAVPWDLQRETEINPGLRTWRLDFVVEGRHVSLHVLRGRDGKLETLILALLTSPP